jgi:protein subunit release factor B
MYGAWRGGLDGEEGIHRLVQRSPLGDKQRRAVSSVRVYVDGETSEDVVHTYVTFPYRLITDHRTGRETDEIARVLGGDLSSLREPG